MNTVVTCDSDNKPQRVIFVLCSSCWIFAIIEVLLKLRVKTKIAHKDHTQPTIPSDTLHVRKQANHCSQSLSLVSVSVRHVSVLHVPLPYWCPRSLHNIFVTQQVIDSRIILADKTKTSCSSSLLKYLALNKHIKKLWFFWRPSTTWTLH